MIREFSRTGLAVWQNLMIDAYPSLYREINPVLANHPLYASVLPSDRCNLRYGFEMQGSGWISILEEFSKTVVSLEHELRSSGLQPDAYIRSSIVREKLGLLIFQVNHNLREPFASLYRGSVIALRDRSCGVCMRCGRPGKLRQLGWLMIVMCEDEFQAALHRLADSQERSGS